MTGDSRIPCPSSPSVADEKQAAKSALRKALRTARGGLDPAIKVQWDAHIGAQVVAWWRLRQVSVIGVYWPLAGEPDLRAAYAELHQAGVRLALPVVMERDAPLTFTEWTPGEAMLPDEAGVQVPAQLRFIELPPALLRREPACQLVSRPTISEHGRDQLDVASLHRASRPSAARSFRIA